MIECDSGLRYKHSKTALIFLAFSRRFRAHTKIIHDHICMSNNLYKHSPKHILNTLYVATTKTWQNCKNKQKNLDSILRIQLFSFNLLIIKFMCG